MSCFFFLLQLYLSRVRNNAVLDRSHLSVTAVSTHLRRQGKFMKIKFFNNNFVGFLLYMWDAIIRHNNNIAAEITTEY